MGLSPHLEAATANHPRDAVAPVNPAIFNDVRLEAGDWQTNRADQRKHIAFAEDGTFVIPPMETEDLVFAASSGDRKDISKKKIDNFQKPQCNIPDDNPENWSQLVNDGDTYLVDSNGNVNVYAYATNTGAMQDTFQVNRRDAGCEIIEFSQNGKTWLQVENDKWMYVTSDGQVSERLYEFEFNMDENGVHARGQDSHFLNIPGQSYA